jgi:hypothetical protein
LYQIEEALQLGVTVEEILECIGVAGESTRYKARNIYKYPMEKACHVT